MFHSTQQVIRVSLNIQPEKQMPVCERMIHKVDSNESVYLSKMGVTIMKMKKVMVSLAALFALMGCTSRNTPIDLITVDEVENLSINEFVQALKEGTIESDAIVAMTNNLTSVTLPLKSDVKTDIADEKIVIKIDGNNDSVDDLIYILTLNEDGVVSQTETDLDADGETDRIENYTYGDDGNIAQKSIDLDADGAIDQIESYTYDSSGNITKKSTDLDADGESDIIETYTYDSDGNILVKNIDLDGDGTIDNVESYTYDDDGNILVKNIDLDGDGDPDIVSTYTYSEDGKVTEHTDLTRIDDGDVDGTTVLRTYDENDLLTKEEFDFDNDGQPERIDSYTYDLYGRITEKEQDFDNDGEIDSVLYFEHDKYGYLTYVAMDFDADGALDEKQYRYYNEFGCQIRQEIEYSSFENGKSFMDGKLDQIDTYEEVDEYCRIIKRTVDRQANGVDEIRTYKYDEKGYMTEITSDYNYNDSGVDGKIDKITYYTNNVYGKVIKAAYDNYADGIVDRADYFERDENGNTIKISYDYYNDDKIDRIIESIRDENIRVIATKAGAVIEQRDDLDADGIVDKITYYKDYDDYGLALRAEFDLDADGKIDRIEKYTSNYRIYYLGKITSKEVDYTNDGVFEYKESYTLNGSGWTTKVEQDFNNDGVIDSSYSKDYKGPGLAVKVAYDYQNDGQADLNSYTYRDNILFTVSYGYDFNVDGVVDKKYSYKRDPNGFFIGEERDYNMDGVADYNATYTTDDIGRRLTAYIDLTADDGVADREEIYKINPQGYRVELDYDYDLDGTVDRNYSYDVDSYGKQSVQYYDFSNDGAVDRTYYQKIDNYLRVVVQEQDTDTQTDTDIEQNLTFTYNTIGLKTATEYDADLDGAFERKISYTYDNRKQLIRYIDDLDVSDDTIDKKYTYIVNEAALRQVQLLDYDVPAKDGLDKIVLDYGADVALGEYITSENNGSGGLTAIAFLNNLANTLTISEDDIKTIADDTDFVLTITATDLDNTVNLVGDFAKDTDASDNDATYDHYKINGDYDIKIEKTSDGKITVNIIDG